MADANNKIAVDGLEFYEIKNNLKRFLSSQDKFKDYNFEGSGLSILLDLLAYNTHYINYYSNMVANEMFLDTATVRDSVVSHSKLLGYTPTSNKGARAQVSVTVAADGDGGVASEFLPRYSTFLATGGGVSFSFRTIDTYKFEPKSYDENGIVQEYWIPEVTIVEGRPTVSTFVVDRTNSPSQRFVIPESNIDLSTLKVRVQASVTNISGYDEYWTLVSDPLQLSPTSKVYFVQETENTKYEVYFGDDIAGKGLQNGNIVVLEYLVTSADPTEANGIGATDTESVQSFSLEASDFADPDVVTIDPALGGSEREGIDSIKYYAPRGFQAQDRAVTVEDYSFMLARDYPFADSIYVWGGEDNTPPVYGKVFVSIKPSRGTSLTNQEKEAIKTGILKKFNIVGVTPEIVDPDYTYLKFETTIKMNPTKTTKTPNEVKQVVKNAVNSYVNGNLGKFGGNLLASRLSSNIDSSDTSVEASGTVISLEKRISPNYGVDANYTTDFSNPIEPETITSNGFLHFDAAKASFSSPYSVAYLRDDGNGQINVVTYEPLPGTSASATSAVSTNPTSLAEKPFRVLKSRAGSINYGSGQVDLPTLNIAGLSGINPVLKIGAQPSNFAEIVADKNQLLVMDNADPTSNFVDVKLSTEGRLNSPSSARNQPKFQAATTQQSTTTTTPATTQASNAAKPKESSPTPKGYPKC
jgi:hypothetical protein